MDDAALVRRLERIGDLPGDRQCVGTGIAPRPIRDDRPSPSTNSMTRATPDPPGIGSIA